MNFLKSLFLFVLIISLQTLGTAQEWISYQSQGQVNDLIDIDGDLVMATNVGLVVLDKTTLEKTFFDKSNTSLSNNHIQSIAQAPNGNSWIGTYDVIIGRFDGTDVQDTFTPDSEAYNQNTKLYDLEIAANGDFWLATSSGVFRKQGEEWTHYGEAELGVDFFEAWDIEINEAGELFVATTSIHQFVNETWVNISGSADILNYLNAGIFFSSTGEMYLSGDLNNIWRFDGSTWQALNNGGLNGSEIIGVTEDAAGDIYFNTRRDGVFILEGNVWESYEDAQTEAFDNESSFFYIDNDDTRWLNNNIHLSRQNANGDLEATLISEHTIEFDNIYKMRQAHDGSLYFLTASNNNISVRNAAGEWSLLPVPNSIFEANIVYDILVLESNIWFATQNGLYFFDGASLEILDTQPARELDLDAQGKIYVRSSAEIYTLEDNEVTTVFNSANSPLSGAVISGHRFDPDNNLWIVEGGNNNRILQLSNLGVWTLYEQADYPMLTDLGGNFHFDAAGNVWLPLSIGGAIRYDGTTWTNPFVGNLDQIANSDIHSIASDTNGKIYFSHQYGVVTLLEGEWENLLIEDVPPNFSHDAEIILDANNTLWWASSRYGLFAYNTEESTSISSGIEKNVSLNLYPNPTCGYSVLNVVLEENAEVQVAIYNNLGQLQIKTNYGYQQRGIFYQSFDVSTIPKGFYTLQLQINTKRYSTRLMVQ